MFEELEGAIQVKVVDFKRLSRISPSGATIFLSYTLIGGELSRDLRIGTNRKLKMYTQSNQVVLQREDFPVIMDLLKELDQLYPQVPGSRKLIRNKREK